MNATLSELRYFIAVVEHASFTRAAQELRISQPSLSRSIADLERSVGLLLLRRTTRSVEVTAEGAEFAVVARDIVTAYTEGLGRFAAFTAGLRGFVTIAALPSLAAGAVLPIVARFAESHPDVHVHIREGFENDVMRDVRNGTADLAVTDSADKGDDIDHTVLASDPMVVVFGVDSPLATLNEISWNELADHPFIAFADGSSVRRLTDLGFDSASARPSHVLEAGSISTAAGMVGARLGITAVPRTVVQLMTFTPLATCPLIDPVVTRKIALHTRKRPALAPAARDLAELILQMGLP